MLSFVRVYLDRLLSVRCSSILFIYQAQAMNSVVADVSAFLKAGFLFVIHSPMLDYFVYEEMSACDPHSMIIVVDASDLCASISIRGATSSELVFIPDCKIDDKVMVERMVRMATDEFLQSFQVDVGKDSYLQTTLPQCCTEAYQLYRQGKSRVSITLQRDEKKLKVIFNEANFELMRRVALRYEILKAISTVESEELDVMKYLVVGDGPLARTAQFIFDNDVLLVKGVSVRLSGMPCAAWRERFLQGVFVQPERVVVNQIEDSCFYAELLSGWLREESELAWGECVESEEEEVAMRRCEDVEFIEKSDTLKELRSAQPCLVVGEEGETVVYDHTSGVVWSASEDDRRVQKGETVLYQKVTRDGFCCEELKQDQEHTISTSQVGPEGVKCVCKWRRAAEQEEFHYVDSAERVVIRPDASSQIDAPDASLAWSERSVVAEWEGARWELSDSCVVESRNGEGVSYRRDGCWYDGVVGERDRDGVARNTPRNTGTPHNNNTDTPNNNNTDTLHNDTQHDTPQSTNTPNGNGVLYGRNDEVVACGLWKNGKVISSALRPAELKKCKLGGESEEDSWVGFVNSVFRKQTDLTPQTEARCERFVTHLLKPDPIPEEEEEVMEEDPGFGVVLTRESAVSQIPSWHVDRVAENKYRIATEEGDIVYLGEMKDDKLEGDGILYYKNGGKEYEGRFWQNLWHGRGKWFHPNGTIHYQGMWKEGVMDGQGMLFKPVNLEYCNSQFRRYARMACERDRTCSFSRGFDPFNFDGTLV